jgi:hypothetical protein
MSGEKITREELRNWFGGTIPMEVVNLLWGASDNKTIGEVRDEVRAMAKTWRKPHQDIKDIYSAIRGGREPMDIHHWEDLSLAVQETIQAVFNAGILAASEYVDGNWSDARTMAEHLRHVGNGDKPMYEE